MDASKCLNQRQMLDYLRGSLAEAEAQAVEEHVSCCDTCEAALRTQDGLSEVLFATFQDAEAESEQFASETHFRKAAEAVEKIAETKPVPIVAAVASDAPTQQYPASGGVAPESPGVPAHAASSLPRTVGEYELLQRLGAGGMGTVYKARHLRLNRLVAVKMLHERRADDAMAAARFDREMMAVGALDHPNIVRAMDAREVDGQRLLVMELVDGVDLALLVRRAGPLPIADACEIIRQTALGLQSAHDRGLVHRDIKPSNLMLTILPSPAGRGAGGEGGEGVVKVLDLGLAMFQEQLPSEEEVSASGQALGTAEYTSPEQISDSHLVDNRADIYSLGCTFFKLFTGHAPFEGPGYPTRIEKLSAHLLKAVPDVRTLRPDVPEELAELLARMTAKSTSARCASMAQVAEGLLKFSAGHDLRRLLQRAADGNGQTTTDAGTEELYTSALVSTGGSKRRQEILATDVRGDAARPASGKHRRNWPRALVLCGAALTAMILVAIITVITDRGTLKIETLDKDVRVVVSRNGREVKIIDTISGNKVELHSGEYQLELADDRGELTLSTDKFTLSRGGSEVVKVSRRPIPPPPPVASSAAAKEHQQQCAKNVGIPVEISNSVGMKLVLIPSGEFLMGSPDSDREAADDEKPQHRVRITRPFYLGSCEVTQSEYVTVMGSRAAHVRQATSIAATVPEGEATWQEAAAFCQKLSEMPAEKLAARTYRLPTEAEWEYACRAETTAHRSFPDAQLADNAWYAGNRGALTSHPVAQKKPNPWGLYDMIGNVWEWVADWYDGNYYAHSPVDDPRGPRFGSDHVTRGASWGHWAGCCRSAYRALGAAQDRHWAGFRVVCVVGADSRLDKPAPVQSQAAKSGPETVALKDFFKDVPGRWVPVLASEKDLTGCQIDGPDPGFPAAGMKFQSQNR